MIAHTGADTAARLQEAVRREQPIPIPGALEPRVGWVEATDIIDDPVAASARTAAVIDRIHLGREAKRPRPLLSRIWRRVLRGPEADVGA
jgi:hypothetical protein